MSKFLLSTFFIILISTCASDQMNQNQIDEESEEDLICKTEKVAGSHIPEVNCWTKEELEKLEEKARRMLQSEQRRKARMGS